MPRSQPPCERVGGVGGPWAFPPVLVCICSSAVSSVLFLVQGSEKRKEKFPSLVHFSPLLPWHSALAWQPFMPKKYSGAARSPSSCAAGREGGQRRAPCAPRVPVCARASSRGLPPARASARPPPFLRGDMHDAGTGSFHGDMRAALPQVPEIAPPPPPSLKPCCHRDGRGVSEGDQGAQVPCGSATMRPVLSLSGTGLWRPGCRPCHGLTERVYSLCSNATLVKATCSMMFESQA